MNVFLENKHEIRCLYIYFFLCPKICYEYKGYKIDGEDL